MVEHKKKIWRTVAVAAFVFVFLAVNSILFVWLSVRAQHPQVTFTCPPGYVLVETHCEVAPRR